MENKTKIKIPKLNADDIIGKSALVRVKELDSLIKGMIDNLSKVSSGKDLTKYWKTQENLIEDVLKKFEDFNKNANETSASNLLKVTNALKAVHGLDLSDIIPNFNELEKSLQSAKQISKNLDSAFDVSSFKSAFDVFETLEKEGLDISEIFNKIGKYSNFENITSELNEAYDYIGKLERRIERLNNKLAESNDENGISKLKEACSELQYELDKIRSESEEAFSIFLKSNNIVPNNYLFEHFFERIRNGSLTAKEAIAEFKRDYFYLLENNTSFDTSQLQDFSTKIENILKKILELHNKIDNNTLNGFDIKQNENFGTMNDEKIESVLSLFNDIKVALFDIKSVISDVGDGEEFSPLLKIINEVNDAVDNLGKTFSKINLNINISNNDNDEEYLAKVESKKQVLLDAYREQFNAMKDFKVDGKEIIKAFSRKYDHNLAAQLNKSINIFNEQDFDNIDQKIKAYENIIKKIREVSELTYGKDIYQDIDPRYKNKISSAKRGITIARNTQNMDSGNSLSELFGGNNSTEIISSLDKIIEKLENISKSLNEINGSFKEGFNVSASFEEINKLTNKVRELEGVIEKLRNNTPPTNVNESVNSSIDKAVNSAKELDDTLEKINIPTKSFDEVLSKLDRSKSELQEIVKITKKSVANADGSFSTSYTLKDKNGSTEIYGMDSKTNKGQILHQNIVKYDSKAEAEKARKENQKSVDAALKKQLEAQKNLQRICKEIAATDNADEKEKLKDLEKIYKEQFKNAGKVLKANKNLYDSESHIAEMKRISLETDIKIAKQKNKSHPSIKDLKDQSGNFQTKIKGLLLNPKDFERLPEYAQRLNEINEKIKEYNEFVASLESKGVIDEKDIDMVNKLTQNIDDLFLKIKEFRPSQKGSTDESKGKEIDRISKYLKDNTGISKKAKEELQKYIDLLKSDMPVDIANIHKEFLRIAVAEREAGRECKNFWDILSDKVAYGYAAQLAGYYLSFMDIVNYVRNGINAIIELDTALVDLKKTTSMNSSELERFYFNSNDVARQTGATTAEIIDQASAWSRLGYSSNKEATRMAEMTAKFAAVSPDLDMESSTDGLVSSMKAFGIEVEDAERRIVDNINKIGNTAATSNGEIVNMLTRSSAAMAAANNTIEETIALETAAIEITRNAETTGTAFKTISMRIRGYDEETEELSDDLKTISGDIADLTKTASTPTGISLFTDETKQTYKSTYQILKEISEIYDELSDKNRAELLEKLAGKRGGQVVSGLLSNFEAAEKALLDMENAAGSADSEMSIVEESLEYKINRFKETWVGTAQQLIERGDIGKIVDGFTKISEAVGILVTNLGLIGTTGFGLGLAKFFKNFDQIKSSVKAFNLSKAFGNIVSNGGSNESVMEGLKDAVKDTSLEVVELAISHSKLNEEQVRQILSTKKLRGELLELKTAELLVRIETNLLKKSQSEGISFTGGFKNAIKSLWGVIAKHPIQSAMTAITILSSVYNAYKNHVEEIRKKTAEAAEEYKNVTNSVEEYTSKYQELHDALLLAKGDEEETYDVKKQLLELQKKINSEFDEEHSKINLVTGAYEDQIESLKNLQKEEANRYLFENRDTIEDAKDEMEQVRGYHLSMVDLTDDPVGIDNTKKALEELVAEYEDEGLTMGDRGANRFAFHISANAEDAYNTMDDFSRDLRELARELGNEELFDSVFKQLSKSMNDAKSVLDDWRDIYKESLMAEIASDHDKGELFNSATIAVEEYNEALAKSEDPYSDDDVRKAKKKVDELKSQMSGEEWEEYSYVIDELFAGADSHLIDFNDELKKNKDLIKDAKALKEKGYTRTDLEAFADSGDNEIFNRLQAAAAADGYELSANELINTLIRLGYVIDDVGNKQDTLNYSMETSRSEMIDLINSMSSGFSELDKIYSDVLDKGSFDFKNLDSKQFSEQFKDLEEEYTDFIQTISSSPNDIDACQAAFNKLTKAYIEQQGVLENIIEENAGVTISMLENMGVANAAAIVKEQLAIQNEKVSLSTRNLSFETWEEINSLMAEVEAGSIAQIAMAQLALEKMKVNGFQINTSKDIENIIALANAGLAGASVLSELTRAKQVMYAVENDTAIGRQYVKNGEFDKALETIDKINSGTIDYNFSVLNATDFMVDYSGALETMSSNQKNAKDSTDALTESMEKQKNALESQKEDLEKQKQEYDDLISAINWFYDKQIEKQQDAIDNIKEQNELLEEQLDGYDGALNAIDRYYEKQQESLQEKIDALDKANDAKEKELALEKAQMALQEARSRKTKLIYSKGTGFTYQTDSKAIKEAEEVLEQQQLDKIKDDLQAEIDKLQEYRDLWKDIPNIKQQAEEDSKMIELLGAEWESILLNGRIENINSFKNQYLEIQNQINSNEQLIESYEEKIAYYEGLKDQWKQLTDRYQEDTYTQLLIGAFGNNFEDVLLNGRTERWDKFATDYYNIQVKLKDITDQIEALSKRMEEYANNMESSANKAVSAVKSAVNAASELNNTQLSNPYQSATNHAQQNGYASGFAKGGVVSDKDSSDLDYIAKSLGEDHMVALKNGEAVIPKNIVQNNAELINSLLHSDGEDFGKLFKYALNNGIVAEKNFDYVLDYMSRDNIPPIKSIVNTKNDRSNFPAHNSQQVIMNFNGDLSFPNIKSGNDAEMLIRELSTLSTTAYQHSKKHN